METLSSILCLIRPNDYTAKINIKDAYYSIPILEQHQKLLKFIHKNCLYKFTALPNGYTEGPRKFTKALKPPLAQCRKNKIAVAGYFDDLITMARDKNICINNMKEIIRNLFSLGFIIHPEKSLFSPTQTLEFLGFVINSSTMTIRLTESKKQAVHDLCLTALNLRKIKIRFLAKILGKFSSSLIGAPLGKLHYRSLERTKIQALKVHKGNYEKFTDLTDSCKKELTWWKNNIFNSESPILRDNPTHTLSTDASLLGWGASFENESTGGQFNLEECKLHINVLELKAVLFGLQSFCYSFSNSHILLKIDNTSAVTSINKMGSLRSLEMDNVVQQIWYWAIHRNIWLTATHVPGKENVEADKESRKQEQRTEWMLNKKDFNLLLHKLNFTPKIDLFASRLNCQIPKFVSYRPDPQSSAVNAFTLNWGNLEFYAFPPFTIIPRIIQKIIKDRATGILVVPDWPNQPWYTIFNEITISSIIIHPRIDLLQLPQSKEIHPLHRSLTLIAALVSGM